MCVYTLLPLVNCQPLLHPWTQTFLQSKWWYNAMITKKRSQENTLKDLENPISTRMYHCFGDFNSQLFPFCIALLPHGMVLCYSTTNHPKIPHPIQPHPLIVARSCIHIQMTFCRFIIKIIHIMILPPPTWQWHLALGRIERLSQMEMRGKCRH